MDKIHGSARSTLNATINAAQDIVRQYKNKLNQWWSNQDSHIVDVVRGASIAGVLKILSGILQFGLTVVLGRVLGAQDAGVYFLALTTTTIAATIGRVGLDSAVIRFVSALASAHKWGDVNAVYRATISIGVACSAVIFVILIFAATFLANTVFSDASLAGPIRVMAIAVIPLALNVLISRALQGLSDIRDSGLVFSIFPAGISLAGTWLLAYRWGVNGAIVAYVIAIAMSVIYGGFAWRRVLAKRSSGHQFGHVAPTTKDLLRSGSPLLIGALLQLVIQMSGTILLGVWAGIADVSLFSVAWRTAMLINLVLLAVNASAQPKFAALYARQDMAALAATARKATLLMTVCAAPVFLVFLLAPAFIMGAFGSDFAAGAACLQILSIGQFVNVATGSVGALLVMSGHERDYRNGQIAAACIVLLLNYALIRSHGAVGAAIAAASALVVQNILFGYLVWARLRILMLFPRSLVYRSAGDA